MEDKGSFTVAVTMETITNNIKELVSKAYWYGIAMAHGDKEDIKKGLERFIEQQF
jgi:hypothetical protein